MDAANIMEVISESVQLRKSGTSYKGKCPFHDDTSPSFVVTPAKGIYKCFACGESGDVVTFLMKHNGWSFPETIKWLADKYGINIEEEKPRVNKTEEAMWKANEWAAGYFAMNMTEESGKMGMEYFAVRGFSEETIHEFRLGYALPNNSALSMEAFKNNITRTTLQKVGLAYKGDDTNHVFDRFTDRVIFPWLNTSGRVVAFAGRKLEAGTHGVEQKHINSCESAIYSKANELYGIYQAKSAIRITNHVYIVEGYTDVISMHQAGVKNVVSCSGCALSATQAHLLKRFCENVTLMFDGDEAGLKAATRNIEPLLQEGMNVKVIVLAKDVDPDNLAREKQEDDLRNFLNTHAIDFLDFYSTHIVDKVTDIPAKSTAITHILQVIGKIPNEVTKSLYLNECHKCFGIAMDAINNALGMETLAERIDRLEAEVEAFKKKELGITKI